MFLFIIQITLKEEPSVTSPTATPNVENAFSSNDTNQEKSHIIGVRNTTAKRTGVSEDNLHDE